MIYYRVIHLSYVSARRILRKCLPPTTYINKPTYTPEHNYRIISFAEKIHVDVDPLRMWMHAGRSRATSPHHLDPSGRT